MESDEATKGAAHWRVVAVCVAVAILAFALRMYGIGDKSIWLDEAWSWRAASLSLGDMVDWTAADRHPPLYYAVLGVFVDAFGDSEAMLRLPSALVSCASVGLLSYVGWRTGGWPLALAAGGLLAVHPTHIEFAQEARMYPLMGLLALASTVALAAVIDRPSILRAIAYAVLLTAMMYTHYSAMLVVGVHIALLIAFAAWKWRDGGRAVALYGIGAVGVAAIAFAPWYGNFIESAREGVGHLPEPSWRLADLVFSSLLGLQRAGDLWLAIALPLVAFGVFGVAKRVKDPYVACIAAIALVPLAQFAVSWLRTPVLDARQASPYIAGFVFVAAIGLIEAGQYAGDLLSHRKIATPVAAAAGAIVGVLMFAAAVDWYDAGPREDWRKAASVVDERGGSVLVWRGYIDVPLRYYTDTPATASPPTLPPPNAAAARTLVLSHHIESEGNDILSDISTLAGIGEPIMLQGIVVYPLMPR